MRNLDIRLDRSEGGSSVVPAAKTLRVYESSFPDTVSVVLLNDLGVIYAGTRISRDSAQELYHALGDYLIATNPNREE